MENVAQSDSRTMNVLRGSGGQFVKYMMVQQDDHFASDCEQNAGLSDDEFNDGSSKTVFSYISKFSKVRWRLDYLRIYLMCLLDDSALSVLYDVWVRKRLILWVHHIEPADFHKNWQLLEYSSDD